MKKEELKIYGLSYTQVQSGSYILVLGQIRGNLKLPIIIKSAEAQVIAMKIEKLESSKPFLQDVIKNLTENMGVDLQQVYISHILEGVFYSKLIFSSLMEDFEINCSVADAIALAITYGCPIMCSKEVLSVSGIHMSEDGEVTEEQEIENKQDRDYKSIVTVDNLQKMLEKAIENEEYEIASQLRDRITELKEK